MPKSTGTFVWYELMTPDVNAAVTFYSKVMGWNVQDFGQGDKVYKILSAGTNGVGGIMPLCDEAAKNGAQPGWKGYIFVDDVDSYVERVQKLGGKLYRPAEDIPTIGRFAVVGDPGGAAFMLFKPSSNEERSDVKSGTPGHTGWHELQAAGRDKAFAFYSSLFGWTKAQAVDMGAMGVYQTFATGGEPCGGMMTKVPECPKPFWLYYFNVENIDAAIARVTKAGGKIFNGPMQVPGGSWIIQGFDPQGAMFALVGPR